MASRLTARIICCPSTAPQQKKFRPNIEALEQSRCWNGSKVAERESASSSSMPVVPIPIVGVDQPQRVWHPWTRSVPWLHLPPLQGARPVIIQVVETDYSRNICSRHCEYPVWTHTSCSAVCAVGCMKARRGGNSRGCPTG